MTMISALARRTGTVLAVIVATATLSSTASIASAATAFPTVDTNPASDVTAATAGTSPEGVTESTMTAAANDPISRTDVRTRARSWIDEQVPYSQTTWYTNQYGYYRQDCSGYVSMAWGMDKSYTTYTIQPFLETIERSDLRPGDVLWRHDPDVQHIALFMGWADAAHTRPIVWEEYDYQHFAEQRVWDKGWADSFHPRRYKNITSGNFGRADIVRINTDGTLTGWHNNDAFTGQWNAPANLGGVGPVDHTRLQLADLDGDNKSDLIRIEANGQLTAWWNNNAFAGQWNSPVNIGGVGSTDHTRLRFADLDGDNKSDLIRIEANGTLTAWRNLNAFAGQWSAPTNIGGVGSTDHTRLRFADLDADGRADLVRIESDGQLTAWWNNNALAGQWNSPVNAGGLGAVDHTRVELADLDADGKADIVRTNTDGTLTGWHNNNAFAGQWNAPANLGGVGPVDHTRLRFADLD
ncbi:hypothetical protein GCM10022243_02560 [Saccharothrix violaceirubra]|uniref:VCBS repeat protein n=1 Tax=Saccharothrix violaceirubra TaxID=413306 RepID=A0A7W7T3Q9_9PSEU|nr:FG-GAP-like repeat-containing protein [Saccharothrix violaceirubra]MBB4966014.1 hypothetical protein [Saccharothrix violaceirubra]